MRPDGRRRTQNTPSATIALLALVLASAAPAAAQQITGMPGSLNATTTIEGNQLPLPPKFGGETDWWTPYLFRNYLSSVILSSAIGERRWS